MKMITKQQSLDDQLRQFDSEDDNISLADLVQKATKVQDAKLSAKAEKNGEETNLDEVTAVKKKRVTYSLTSAVILSKDGLDDLKSRVEKFSTKSSSKAGYETADLSRLLQIYRAWSENLGVRESANWPDFVEKLDRLKKNDIRKYIAGLREGREEETTQIKNPNLVPVRIDETVSAKDSTMAPPAVPPASTLTEEQRQLIEQKRLESIRRREERLKLLKADPVPETLMLDKSSGKDDAAGFSQMQTQVLGERYQSLDTGNNFSQAPTQVFEHQATNAVMANVDAEEGREATTSVSDTLNQTLPSSEQCASPKKLRVIDECR